MVCFAAPHMHCIGLDDEKGLKTRLKPFRLRYQLEKGVTKEGLWFEGSLGYHYYALEGCRTSWLLPEKPARGLLL